MAVPHGFRFNPTDEELIQILHRKASGQEMPLHFILAANVYEREPQDLEWNHTTALSYGERYYYCKREINDSREVLGRGWWKATSHVKKVYSNYDHQLLVGNKRPLTFHRFKDHERNRNNAIKTNWIMHEYSLESRTTEWRLCKIKYKGKPSMQEEMENVRQQYSLRNDSEAGNSTNIIDQFDSNIGDNQQLQANTLPPANSTMPLDYNGFEQPYIPQSPCDLYLPAPLSSSPSVDYFVEPSNDGDDDEQPFPSLWSWKN